ncbi:inorganic phosphate transporter [Robbsia andropogonis]|uniref:inorganic phosphate transporter n=1 Tax=Robbsia andropogonis TaxID=28092 RepID=UPI0004B9277B|nr:inorganic phosphate transporter [Robbsia andropogonis]MCP1119084.1 inorganic phosphate transporter [Robbsia andropogonis]MCP1129065.1 inorganic phosphate transporter [Robbsia andropogonis]
MLSHFVPSSGIVIAMLAVCFLMVLAFEATNGFHDASNAVATVIYTNSLKATPAVVWSGICNFVGVLVGGITVAYALVEILPPDVLTPPNGAPAVPMLVAIFASALFWNVLTWAFGVPNSSSHCIIGSLIGVAAADALLQSRSVAQGVDWKQILVVLKGLAISPVLGFVLAGALYGLLRIFLKSRGHLFVPPAPHQPPVWWMRVLLILTCTSVSFSHGTNDGQKSIGLIMLTIIGMLPATYALNPSADNQIRTLSDYAGRAIPLIALYGDDMKAQALTSASRLHGSSHVLAQQAQAIEAQQQGQSSPLDANGGQFAATRAQLRGDVYQIVSQMKHVAGSVDASAEERHEATEIRKAMRDSVEYAPLWVRLLSALCLGVGTMFGYQRVVRTLGERLGKQHMTPGQGASAELVGSVLIGTAGFTGLPVSTTHIVTSGIAGTMAAGGQGLQPGMLIRIVLTWIVTLPVTMLIAGVLFYVLDNPAL